MSVHENALVVLQILREVKQRSMIYSGSREQIEFVIKNKLITRTQWTDLSGTIRLKYKLTEYGEGMMKHIEEKHEGKENADQSKN